MDEEWEEYFQGPSRSAARRLVVSLSARSELNLNKWAVEAMGNPRAVVLLFDRARSRIGLRASPSDLPNAFPLKASNRSKRSRPFKAYLKAFCKTHNIRNTSTIRFTEPRIDDGILILDLPPMRDTS